MLLKHRNWRIEQDKEKDIKKVNIKYLSGIEAKERLRKSEEEKRKLEKNLIKLKQRIKKFVDKETISTSAEFSNDIAKIFQENQNVMTPVQKLFWGEQLKSLSCQKNPRQMRWNPFIIKLALHIQMISSSAYNYLQLFLNLPSGRTLYDFTHYVNAQEGIQETSLYEMSTKLKQECRENHEQYFNLVFDEIVVREGIVINRRTGEVVGYTHLTDLENELKALESEILTGSDPNRQPAKKVLVYLALGITNSLQDIVAVFTTSGSMTAVQLHTRTWDVIYRMESHQLKVLCCICDGATINKKFFRMHAKGDLNCEYVYSTRNVASGEDRLLFFIVDPVHVLKSLRNNFANSFSHKKTRKMWKNGQTISWSAIESLFSLTQKFKYQETKLTKAHVRLTAHSCMKVIYAAQVMGLSVYVALGIFADDPIFDNIDLGELREFIRLVNLWFDCMNCSSDIKGTRINENDYLRSFTDSGDSRFDFLINEFLAFFEKWHQDVLTRPGNFSKDTREKMFISLQTYESLQITTRAFIAAVKTMLNLGAPSVNGRKFNQDKIEQFFGLLRMAFGGNRNPSVAEVVQKTMTLHIQGEAAKPNVKGNTQVVRREWIPDETPLPKRPRKS